MKHLDWAIWKYHHQAAEENREKKHFIFLKSNGFELARTKVHAECHRQSHCSLEKTKVYLLKGWMVLRFFVSVGRQLSYSVRAEFLWNETASLSLALSNQRIQMAYLGGRPLCLNKLTLAWLGCLPCERASEYIDLCLIKYGGPAIWYHDRRILLLHLPPLLPVSFFCAVA